MNQSENNGRRLKKKKKSTSPPPPSLRPPTPPQRSVFSCTFDWFRSFVYSVLTGLFH